MSPIVPRIASFVDDLKRRKVFHVASFYLVTAWGLSLGAAEFFPAFGLADAAVRVFVVVAALGFPVAVGLAWAYDITSRGVVLDPGRAANARVSATTVTAVNLAGSVRIDWHDVHGDHHHTFARAFTLGRDSDCELALDDPMVSRRHAKISPHGERWYVEDLASRNGTLVDGRSVEREVLADGAEIRLYPNGPRLSVTFVSRGATTVSSINRRRTKADG